MTRGLDGAVGENMTEDGLLVWLEFSVVDPGPVLGALRLDVASAFTFLRSFGLPWALSPPPVPLEATERKVRG